MGASPSSVVKPGRQPRTGTGRVVSLREDIRGRPQAVDVAAGVIKGVKVLGLVSDNGRRYLAAAVATAAPLYEGKGVYLDHPSRPHEQRSARDRIGWLEHVRVESDGLYADLHLLTSDPAAAKILEAARKRPELFGLSHNAEGKGEQQDGVFVVSEITEVRSVDLVADPATNKSLFEGRRMGRTLRQLIEQSKVKPALKARLLEMGDMGEADDTPLGDMPAPEPPPDAGPDEGDWKQCLVDAIGKLVDSGDEADHKLASKIMRMLKPGAAKGGEEKDTEESDDDEPKEKKDKGDDKDDKEKKDKEKKTEEGRRVQTTGTVLTEARAKQFCALAGLEPSKDVLEALAGTPEDKALAVLGLLKKQATRPGSAPRSSGSLTRPVQESRQPKDAKEQATMLLRG
ncbi:MAG: hypothetical protein V4597_11565 [Pseudomonadota bacterium]